MMRNLFILFAALLLEACVSSIEPQIDSIHVTSEISGLMKEQENSWNQADLKGFMKHYWNNDSLLFIGSNGPVYGWTNALENYRRSYPNGTSMGILKFTNIKMEVLSSDNAFVVGRWELFRVADTLSGHYSLLWKKINGQWVIVADHSS